MLGVKSIAATVVILTCSAAHVLGQTQPAVPPPSPAPVQPSPSIPAGGQPQSSGVTQPPQPPAPVTAPAPPPPITPAVQTPGGATTPRPIADSDHGTSILLLERILKLLDQAADGKGNQVSLDRALVDEMRAEITQVKLTLQAEK